jgi:hypothetical protein
MDLLQSSKDGPLAGSHVSANGFRAHGIEPGDFNMPSTLITDLLDVLDRHAGGIHPGFRPVHARA